MERPTKRAKVEAAAAVAVDVAVHKARFGDSGPHRHTVVHNALDADFLREVRGELVDVEYDTLNTDVCERFVTDLKDAPAGKPRALVDQLYHPDLRSQLTEITGIALTDQRDVVAEVMRQGGHHVCHPVLQGSRRLGFVLFLSGEGEEGEGQGAIDGGLLRAYDVDNEGRPTKPAVSVSPQWNTLVVFEITAATFHEVTEVVGSAVPRLCVVGFYHGEELPAPDPARCPAPPWSPISREAGIGESEAVEALREWVRDDLVSDEALDDMQQSFEKDSSIELSRFLRPDKMERLQQGALQPGGWKERGFPHQMRFLSLTDQDKADATLREFRVFLCSPAFRWFVERITNLTPVAVAAEERKFGPGHYITNHDDQCASEYFVDVVFCVQGLDEEAGGLVCYQAVEGDELLTVVPETNALSIVYRDVDTVQYLKFVNHSAEHERVDCVVCFRVEDEGDDEHDEHDGNEDEPGEEGA